MKNHRDDLLRNVLRSNAIFSASSGLLITLAAGPIAQWMGISETSILGIMDGGPFLQFIGVGLLLYAALLAYLSTQTDLRKPGQFATTMDVIWVVGSYGLLVAQALPLTTGGSWTVLIVADIVLGFAIAQTWGLRRMAQVQLAHG